MVASNNVRKPRADWRLGRAAHYFAGMLGLPPDAVQFVQPHGKIARTDTKLGTLRDKWERELVAQRWYEKR